MPADGANMRAGLPHGAIRPALTVRTGYVHEQRDTLVLAGLGGPERGNQRQAHNPQLDGVDVLKGEMPFMIASQGE